MSEIDWWPKDNEKFKIATSFTLVCCGCGLAHSVILETKRISKKIYATFSYDEIKTQKVRQERQIYFTRRGTDDGPRTANPAAKEK